VAEYTLAMILLSAKGVLRMRDHYRESRGPVDVQAELDGSGTYRLKVGIIGASTTGRRVIELLRPFDLDVALYDPTVSADEAAALGVRALTLDELIRTSREVARICRGEALHHEVQADAYERLA
jgi:phosphoglycerate dehydrogenase-like enzyme